jgi:hypothetical protein
MFGAYRDSSSMIPMATYDDYDANPRPGPSD